LTNKAQNQEQGEAGVPRKMGLRTIWGRK